MGDMKEVFDTMREQRKERHEKWDNHNTAVIQSSGRPFTRGGGYNLVFVIPGKITVDFYPSTGRWLVRGERKAYRGGAEAFLSWLKKQEEK